MDSELILGFLEYGLRIIIIVVGGFIANYVKTKIDENKLQQVTSWAKIAVRSAEQIFKESGMGEKKKQYVLGFLNNKGVDISPEDLDGLIEAIVYELKNETWRQKKEV